MNSPTWIPFEQDMNQEIENHYISTPKDKNIVANPLETFLLNFEAEHVEPTLKRKIV